MNPNAHKQQALLVFGMHRSGTSATARVLNLLGAELNPELLEASFDNPKGFWEGAEVVTIHERFFAGLSRTWYDMQRLPEGWISHPAAKQAVSEIIDLVERDFSGAALWVAKDPRMCLLAPLWLEALASLNIEVKCLFVVRNPIEVTESLHARHQRVHNQWILGYGPVMWAQYLVEAEVATRGCRRAMMTYDELLIDWRAVMARVSRDLDVVWPNAIDETGARIDAFLDKGDRHHKVDFVASEAARRCMPDIVIRMYKECLLIAEQGKGWDGLGPLAQEFQVAADLYSGALDNILHHYHDDQARLHEIEAQLVDGERFRQQQESTIEAYRIQAEKYDGLLRSANAQCESNALNNAAMAEATAAQIAALDDELLAYRKQAQTYEERLISANAMNVSLSTKCASLVESVPAQIADFERQLLAYREQAQTYEERLYSANALNVSLSTECASLVESVSAQAADFERQLLNYREQALTYDQLLRDANGRVLSLTQKLQELTGHSSASKADE